MLKTGNYANKCPKIKVKYTKGSHKVEKMDDMKTTEDLETKSFRQILVRLSDLENIIMTPL